MRFSFWSKKPSRSLSRSRSRASCSSSVMKWYSWRVTFCRKISSRPVRFKATLRTSDIRPPWFPVERRPWRSPDGCMAPASRDVPARGDAVVFVGHRRDVDEPLHVDLLQLDEQPEGLHARHVALVDLAQLVRHEADLLPLHQLALGLRRAALHLGEVPAHLGQVG